MISLFSLNLIARGFIAVSRCKQSSGHVDRRAEFWILCKVFMCVFEIHSIQLPDAYFNTFLMYVMYSTIPSIFVDKAWFCVSAVSLIKRDTSKAFLFQKLFRRTKLKVCMLFIIFSLYDINNPNLPKFSRPSEL